MDSFQDQIAGLSVRIDGLHQIIERLTEKLSVVLKDVQSLTVDNNHRLQSGISATPHTHLHRYESSFSMEQHKDVLMDDNYPDSDHHHHERNLTPDVQIQRLTAQLTAAYNRIAALEEQLLAQRIH